MQIKKGDIVGRYSYNNDILFFVDRIITLNGSKQIAILKGLSIRIEADAPVKDLKKFSTKEANEVIKKAEENFYSRINKRARGRIEYPGKILHLDGDRRYSEKSVKYYKKLGLNAVVKNVPENRQPQLVNSFLEKYQPDVLIITGHDSMLKSGRNYTNIYNYRNSKYFINAVINARRWQYSSNKLAIFAGACQSFYEAIMEAGADFASSPGRILIDFVDPIIVAEKIATTNRNIYISPAEMIKEIREGEKGVSGVGVMGKKRVYNSTM